MGLRSTSVATSSVTVTSVITNLAGDGLAYSSGSGALVIEQGADALVIDVDSLDFDTGQLTVSIPLGGDPTEDVLSIRNQGVAPGDIGLSGNNVTYGGVLIGTTNVGGRRWRRRPGDYAQYASDAAGGQCVAAKHYL